MKTNSSIEIDVLGFVKENTNKINNIINKGSFNSQTLKELILLYENLFNLTKDIIYKKNIADVCFYYFKDKEKALKYYLEYISVINNDSSVLFTISSIYKSQNDSTNYKKYFSLAINSSQSKINSVIPNSEDVVLGVNIGVAAGLSMNNDVKHGIEIYKKIMQYSPTPNNILMPYIDLELKKANQLFEEKNWKEALVKYKNIFNNSNLEESDFINLISCLAELKENDIALEYLRRYEETTEDKIRANYVIADLLYFKFNYVQEAIERFERHICLNPNDALTYNTLGHLYSTYYNDQFIELQLEYFSKAYNLIPNSKIFTKNLALTYSKIGDFENANKFYNATINLNPTYDDLCDYGCFLIQHKKFKEGFRFFANRFLKETKPALYPPMLTPSKELKNKDDIKNNIILVQCEQGFGDTIMFSRYVNLISKIAKKVLFVVQDKLVDLFKTSSFDAEIYGTSTDYSLLEYDYHVPLVSLPIFLDAEYDNIPNIDGYLSVDEKVVQHFKYEFVENTKKIKVGIAFEGYDVSKDMNRDINLDAFLPIFNMKNVEIYILQHEDSMNQIKDLPKNLKIYNVGENFNSFEDTAAAIKNMDFIVSTDNVILNLAGALGVKTLGLFNKYAEYRWFDLTKNNVGWYSSVKPFQTDKFNYWDDVIQQVIQELR